MAVLWQKTHDGVHYEVRTAGRTRRLYSNGVLHTQYNPSRLWTGSVWDLLLLSALCLPREQVRRVLVLGVGGGAVIRQLLTVFPQVQIVGIELNPVHLNVARRFFGLQDARVELHCENAITWLSLYEGEPFDLVIDDLFGERDGEPCRAVTANADWFDLLLTHLARDGVLAMNFAEGAEVRASAWGQGERAVLVRLPSALSLSTPTCENRVVAFLPRFSPWAAQNPVTELKRVIADDSRLRVPGLRYLARRLVLDRRANKRASRDAPR